MRKNELSENFRGGVLDKSDIRDRFPLQSSIKIDIADLLMQDYFSGEHNFDSDCSRASYKKAEACIDELRIDPEKRLNILDLVEDYACEKETQGFIAGIRYGFSIWESLAK